VLIQIVMIGLVIAFPQMVMVYKAGESTVDPSKVQIIPFGGAVNAPGSETDAAQKALEEMMRGGGNEPAEEQAAPKDEQPAAK
jgi:hypothetical protein